MSSMVRISGRKIKGENQEDYENKVRGLAETFGVKFIKLIWNDPIDTTVAANNFQGVVVGAASIGRNKKPFAEWSVDSQGMPIRSSHLVFHPNELNVGVAYLPDSPFNRRLLGSAYNHNALWHIDNEKIDAEIRVIAEEIENSEEYKNALERTARIRAENQRLNDEQAKKYKPKSESDMQDALAKIADALSSLTTLQVNQMRENPAVNTAINVVEKAVEEKKTKDSGASEAKSGLKLVKNKIKDEVHNEMAETIVALKKKYPRGWHNSKEYIEVVQAEINRRFDERIKNADDKPNSIKD